MAKKALQHVDVSRNPTCVYIYGGFCDLTRKLGDVVSSRFCDSEEGIQSMQSILQHCKDTLLESEYVERVVFCEIVNGNVMRWNTRKVRGSDSGQSEEQRLINNICISTNSNIRILNGPLYTPHLSNVCKRVKRQVVSWRWGVFRDGVHLHSQDKVVEYLLAAYNRNIVL